ncbi:hypothetical protein HRR83_001278 [Exophiala dermatitidis]|uniref:Uncharacterized protein n=1 Tax=Exophiala dermatitidis TaxID=5970 RepID=A0AAN6J1I6_EXODE|nr:hypothetical protein HRR74_001282 [Exophiala dermatitidis]KAJ4526967.1 hypothetical protein HRR73_001764 [Exophiala dermatitidis]KAJ4532681.1 hypothetical protein HRR76_007665 [Exophiala dermatitidis]KAJ4546806.1 hypothetical protein HRR77_004351 [Exophiala dermatitidis]KAJ4573828.1 hypothetical protein HRR79_002837 [Exophiala dermatitidis]
MFSVLTVLAARTSTSKHCHLGTVLVFKRLFKQAASVSIMCCSLFLDFREALGTGMKTVGQSQVNCLKRALSSSERKGHSCDHFFFSDEFLGSLTQLLQGKVPQLLLFDVPQRLSHDDAPMHQKLGPKKLVSSPQVWCAGQCALSEQAHPAFSLEFRICYRSRGMPLFAKANRVDSFMSDQAGQLIVPANDSE